MIMSFRDKETKKVYYQEFSRSFPGDIQKPALRKLIQLDSAECLNDIYLPPSNHLEALKGSRKGQYSIRINKQWRICFIWEKGNVYQVEIVDYH